MEKGTLFGSINESILLQSDSFDIKKLSTNHGVNLPAVPGFDWLACDLTVFDRATQGDEPARRC